MGLGFTQNETTNKEVASMRNCSMCDAKIIKKDKRKKHRNLKRLICRWCASMWVHDCC